MLSKKIVWSLASLCLACSSSAGNRASTGGAGGDDTGGSGGSGDTGGTNGGAGRAGTGGGSGGSSTGGSPGTGGSADTGGAGGSGASGGAVEVPDAAPPTDARANKDSGPTMPPPPPTGCTLRWSPSAMKDGAKAFEGLEMPDLNGVHPGVPHFSVVAEHDAFRIDQHDDPPNAIDYDHNAMDRLRCETKGMNDGTTNLQLLDGQTWKLTWSLYVPASLKASTRFNHIWQMKYVDTAGGSSDGPVATLDLTRQGGAEKIRVDIFGVTSFTAVNLIHDRWLSNEITMKIAPGTGGSVHWKLSDGATVLTDSEKTGLATWPANASRLRPKWGIYRSLGDQADVNTTYILLSDLRGYLCQ